MILDETPWFLGAQSEPWLGIGRINWEFSLGNSSPNTATITSDKQFVGEVQQLGISAILDASMGIL